MEVVDGDAPTLKRIVESIVNSFGILVAHWHDNLCFLRVDEKPALAVDHLRLSTDGGGGPEYRATARFRIIAYWRFLVVTSRVIRQR